MPWWQLPKPNPKVNSFSLLQPTGSKALQVTGVLLVIIIIFTSEPSPPFRPPSSSGDYPFLLLMTHADFIKTDKTIPTGNLTHTIDPISDSVIEIRNVNILSGNLELLIDSDGPLQEGLVINVSNCTMKDLVVDITEGNHPIFHNSNMSLMNNNASGIIKVFVGQNISFTLVQTSLAVENSTATTLQLGNSSLVNITSNSSLMIRSNIFTGIGTPNSFLLFTASETILGMQKFYFHHSSITVDDNAMSSRSYKMAILSLPPDQHSKALGNALMVTARSSVLTVNRNQIASLYLGYLHLANFQSSFALQSSNISVTSNTVMYKDFFCGPQQTVFRDGSHLTITRERALAAQDGSKRNFLYIFVLLAGRSSIVFENQSLLVVADFEDCSAFAMGNDITSVGRTTTSIGHVSLSLKNQSLAIVRNLTIKGNLQVFTHTLVLVSATFSLSLESTSRFIVDRNSVGSSLNFGSCGDLIFNSKFNSRLAISATGNSEIILSNNNLTAKHSSSSVTARIVGLAYRGESIFTLDGNSSMVLRNNIFSPSLEFGGTSTYVDSHSIIRVTDWSSIIMEGNTMGHNQVRILHATSGGTISLTCSDDSQFTFSNNTLLEPTSGSIQLGYADASSFLNFTVDNSRFKINNNSFMGSLELFLASSQASQHVEFLSQSQVTVQDNMFSSSVVMLSSSFIEAARTVAIFDDSTISLVGNTAGGPLKIFVGQNSSHTWTGTDIIIESNSATTLQLASGNSSSVNMTVNTSLVFSNNTVTGSGAENSCLLFTASNINETTTTTSGGSSIGVQSFFIDSSSIIVKNNTMMDLTMSSPDPPLRLVIFSVDRNQASSDSQQGKLMVITFQATIVIEGNQVYGLDLGYSNISDAESSFSFFGGSNISVFANTFSSEYLFSGPQQTLFKDDSSLTISGPRRPDHMLTIFSSAGGRNMTHITFENKSRVTISDFEKCSRLVMVSSMGGARGNFSSTLVLKSGSQVTVRNNTMDNSAIRLTPTLVYFGSMTYPDSVANISVVGDSAITLSNNNFISGSSTAHFFSTRFAESILALRDNSSMVVNGNKIYTRLVLGGTFEDGFSTLMIAERSSIVFAENTMDAPDVKFLYSEQQGTTSLSCRNDSRLIYSGNLVQGITEFKFSHSVSYLSSANLTFADMSELVIQDNTFVSFLNLFQSRSGALHRVDFLHQSQLVIQNNTLLRGLFVWYSRDAGDTSLSSWIDSSRLLVTNNTFHGEQLFWLNRGHSSTPAVFQAGSSGTFENNTFFTDAFNPRSSSRFFSSGLTLTQSSEIGFVSNVFNGPYLIASNDESGTLVCDVSDGSSVFVLNNTFMSSETMPTQLWVTIAQGSSLENSWKNSTLQVSNNVFVPTGTVQLWVSGVQSTFLNLTVADSTRVIFSNNSAGTAIIWSLGYGPSTLHASWSGGSTFLVADNELSTLRLWYLFSNTVGGQRLNFQAKDESLFQIEGNQHIEGTNCFVFWNLNQRQQNAVIAINWTRSTLRFQHNTFKYIRVWFVYYHVSFAARLDGSRVHLVENRILGNAGLGVAYASMSATRIALDFVNSSQVSISNNTFLNGAVSTSLSLWQSLGLAYPAIKVSFFNSSSVALTKNSFEKTVWMGRGIGGLSLAVADRSFCEISGNNFRKGVSLFVATVDSSRLEAQHISTWEGSTLSFVNNTIFDSFSLWGVRNYVGQKASSAVALIDSTIKVESNAVNVSDSVNSYLFCDMTNISSVTGDGFSFGVAMQNTSVAFTDNQLSGGLVVGTPDGGRKSLSMRLEEASTLRFAENLFTGSFFLGSFNGTEGSPSSSSSSLLGNASILISPRNIFAKTFTVNFSDWTDEPDEPGPSSSYRNNNTLVEISNNLFQSNQTEAQVYLSGPTVPRGVDITYNKVSFRSGGFNVTSTGEQQQKPIVTTAESVDSEGEVKFSNDRLLGCNFNAQTSFLSRPGLLPASFEEMLCTLSPSATSSESDWTSTRRTSTREHDHSSTHITTDSRLIQNSSTKTAGTPSQSEEVLTSHTLQLTRPTVGDHAAQTATRPFGMDQSPTRSTSHATLTISQNTIAASSTQTIPCLPEFYSDASNMPPTTPLVLGEQDFSPRSSEGNPQDDLLSLDLHVPRVELLIGTSIPFGQSIPHSLYSLRLLPTRASSGETEKPNHEGFASNFRTASSVNLTRLNETMFRLDFWRADPANSYRIDVGEEVELVLKKQYFDLCATDSDLAGIGGLAVSAIPQPEVVRTKTAATVVTVTAMAGSGAVAMDAQSLAVLGLFSCSQPYERNAMKNNRLLSPLAIDDTYEGMILGNYVLVALLALIHGVVLLLAKTFKKSVESWEEAQVLVRFPTYTLMIVTTQYQGTAAAAIKLLQLEGISTTSFALALFTAVLTISVPLILFLVAGNFITAEFRRYNYDGSDDSGAADSAPGSLLASSGHEDEVITSTVDQTTRTPVADPTHPASSKPDPRPKIPDWLQLLLPVGRWYPVEYRRRFSTLFSSLRQKERLWVTLSCWSPTVILVGLMFKPSGQDACVAQYSSMGAAQLVIVCVVLGFRPYRSLIQNLLAAASNLCLGLVFLSSSLLAADPKSVTAKTMTLRGVQIQIALTIMRTMWSFFQFVIERQVLSRLGVVASRGQDPVWVSWAEQRRRKRREAALMLEGISTMSAHVVSHVAAEPAVVAYPSSQQQQNLNSVVEERELQRVSGPEPEDERREDDSSRKKQGPVFEGFEIDEALLEAARREAEQGDDCSDSDSDRSGAWNRRRKRGTSVLIALGGSGDDEDLMEDNHSLLRKRKKKKNGGLEVDIELDELLLLTGHNTADTRRGQEVEPSTTTAQNDDGYDETLALALL